MMNIEGGTPKFDLLAPVSTDADVLDRVRQVVGPDERCDRLCLLFLAADGVQPPVAVSIDDVPSEPDPATARSLCDVIASVLDDTVPGGSVVITLVRPNVSCVTDSDQRWLMALSAAAERTGVPLRMLCVATKAGVRRVDRSQPGAVSQSAE
jgi:hypothetical protein